MLFKRILNKKGMSLVEVLVAAGLMAIVALGMGGVITSMNKEQNNQTRLATMRELKTRFQNIITDQNAWNKTIQMNGGAGQPMQCLLEHTSCTPGSAFDLTLYEPSGTAFFIPPPYATSPVAAGSRGFTDKGVPCNTFDGAGNDACPISYKVIWEPLCTAPCRNPLVRVTARLLYSPTGATQTTAFSLGTGAITNNEAGAGKYDVVMKRSSTTVNRSFALAIRVTSAGGAVGGGDCPNSFTVRGNSSLPPAGQYPAWTEDSDDFNLVAKDDTTGYLRIQPGTFSCKVTATGWAVGSFQIQLRNVTDGAILNDSIASASTSATSYTQSVATSNPIISISAPKDFVLEQKCQSTAPISKFGMGLTAQPYAEPSTFATFTCTQTN